MGALVVKQIGMAETPKRDLAERTFRFACDIVQFCRKLSAQPGVVRNIAWQLADAGTSVAANYEEAKASYSRREYAAKNAIVLKEAREAALWLRIILACNLASDPETRRLTDEADQLVRIFTASVQKLRRPQTWTKAVLLIVWLFFTSSCDF